MVQTLLQPSNVSDAEVFLIASIGLLASRKMARPPSADADLLPRAALRLMEVTMTLAQHALHRTKSQALCYTFQCHSIPNLKLPYYIVYDYFRLYS